MLMQDNKYGIVANELKVNLVVFVCVILIAASACSKEEAGKLVVTDNVSLLSDQTITSKVLNQIMKYNIVLPNDYYTNTEQYYPVLYLFHGMGGNNNSWAEDGEAKQILQDAFKNEVLEPMVVVMPDAFNTFYVDGYQNGLNYETYFWDEFLPYIENTYRVDASRERRYIAGLSMGGFGASYYAFTHPNKFRYCYSMSGAVEGVGSVSTPSISTIISEYVSFDNLPDEPLTYWLMMPISQYMMP